MIIDLRLKVNQNGNDETLILVDPSRRITCDTFNVWIPSIMPLIPRGLENTTVSNTCAKCLNDEVELMSGEVTFKHCVKARSIHGYRFKHDGWIPEFFIERVDVEDGTIDTIAVSDQNSVTEIASSHVHAIKAGNTNSGNTLTTMTYNTSTVTNSTMVDYQELNQKYIKAGDVLYGSFIRGTKSLSLLIKFIDNVIPYYNEDEDNGSNDQIT